MRIVRAVTKFIYGLTAAVLLPLGGGVLLYNTPLLPQSAKDIILEYAHGDLGTVHLIQEWGAQLVFVALMALWAIKRYDESWGFHWAMTVLLGLDALIHWLHVDNPVMTPLDYVILGAPFALFLVLGLLRWKFERGSTAESQGQLV